MPPASKTPFKFKRRLKSETWLYQDILQSQQTDTNGWLADTLLMCDGGTIRVHAFILQAASPFFRAAILSQGEDYPYVREVMLPDFTVTEMESMLNLIYKGFVDLSSEKEITELKKTLKFFQVTGVDFKSVGKLEDNGIKLEIEGDLKIHELNRIPQDIKVENDSIMEVDVDEPQLHPEEKESNSNGTISGGRRSTRCFAKPQISSVPVSSEKSSKSTKSSSASSTTSSTSTKSLKSVKIILPRVLVDAPPAPSPPPPQPPPKEKSPVKKKKKGNPDDDPETDDEDKDWTQPNFKDKTWFKREALRCQFCKTDHKAIKDVLDCISHHNKQNVRCCFCLRIYSNTEILYRHYKKRHKNCGKENSIMCHFCEQTLAYSAVSSHVISTHFRTEDDPSSKPDKDPKSRPSPSKTNTSSSSTSKNKVKSKSKNGEESSKKHKSKKPKKSSASISSEAKTTASVSASENEDEYNSDVLEDYDPDPTPILIPTSPSKATQLLAASSNRRRRYSGSSDEWSPRKPKANGGSSAGASASISSTSSIPSKKAKNSSVSVSSKETLLKVPDLDVTVKKLMLNGQSISFRLRRKRDGPLENPKKLKK